VNGYYDELIQMLVHTAEKGFMDKKCIDLFCVAEDPADLLGKMF
jgi:predicted Rossmann-fold nucleotide-binding protein